MLGNVIGKELEGVLVNNEVGQDNPCLMVDGAWKANKKGKGMAAIVWVIQINGRVEGSASVKDRSKELTLRYA